MESVAGQTWKSLYNAAKYGDLDSLRSIVDSQKLNPDFDINYQNEKGNTALFIACAWGFQSTPYRQSHFYEAVKFLIERGADVNIPNQEGQTPLYIAASWGHFHVVHLLILHGANLNAQVKVPEDSNLTPLQIAAYKKRVGLKAFQDYETHSQHHAYYLAKGCMERIIKTGEYLRLFPKILEDYKELIGYAAADPSVIIPDAIMELVVKYNHFAVVKELVLAGAKINIPDANGYTAVAKAQQWNDTAMVTFLLENGAEFKVPVDNGPNVKLELYD